MKKTNQEEIVETEANNEEKENKELTPYDNLYREEEEGQINLSFSVNSLSSILALTSLCFTFLYAILKAFGVNVAGLTTGIFFLLTMIIAIASAIFAYKNSKNKINMPLTFSVLTIIINIIVYL